MTDVFARALRDFYRGEQQGPIRYRDGEETEEHRIAGYFEEWSPGGEGWLADPTGPLLDMGAGAGRHALHYQDDVETTAIEPNELLVETMRERGVEDARVGDMFSLREQFDRDAFRGAYSIGTQAGIVKSKAGLRRFLGDLGYVTTPDGTVVFDGYDPRHDRTRDLIGFRADPARTGAYRFVQYEYDGTLGEPWLFRLFTPDEVREATTGTGWDVAAIDHGPDGWEHTFSTRLVKR